MGLKKTQEETKVTSMDESASISRLPDQDMLTELLKMLVKGQKDMENLMEKL